MTFERVAAIDIGTNCVLLTIAEQRGHALVPVVERATITRLGRDVDRTRRLAEDAIAQTLACLESYARELERHAVRAIDVVGTSALRDASGGAQLTRRAHALLGVGPRVLSGVEEAELTFEGAASGLDVSGPLGVFDVGGGSTEIILGERTHERLTIAFAQSLDLGSVRLTERHVKSDPPSAAELAAIDAELASALAKLTPARTADTWIGVAGTVTTLVALAQPDVANPHGARLTNTSVERLAHELARMSVAERMRLSGLDPGRADVIATGARIVLAVMSWAGTNEIVASDRGVRWGLIARRFQAPA